MFCWFSAECFYNVMSVFACRNIYDQPTGVSGYVFIYCIESFTLETLHGPLCIVQRRCNVPHRKSENSPGQTKGSTFSASLPVEWTSSRWGGKDTTEASVISHLVLRVFFWLGRVWPPGNAEENGDILARSKFIPERAWKGKIRNPVWRNYSSLS